MPAWRALTALLNCRPLHWFGFHVVDLKRHTSDQPFAAIEVEVECRPYPDDWRAAIVIIQVRCRFSLS